ncbi:MAG TPA: cupin-like domain-containing protein [Candidatus Binataceae bacterium]|nr:cupin-like domain-containing protein [Candidatus Binataceae bacterium]
MPDAAEWLSKLRQDTTAANQAAGAAARCLEFDPRIFRDCFDREPFAVHHHLAGNALFTLERLAALARFIEAQPNQVYADAGVADLNQRWDESAHPATSLAQTVEQIVGNDTWIILRPLELDREYRLLLNRCLDELRAGIGGDWGRPVWRENSIVFLTSPRRLSTYHIDRECNFILQLQGEKTLYVFDRNDREVLPETELERYWAVDSNAARYKPQYQDRARVFRLRPGDGVHVPVNCPHWVQNDDNVSITLSINFQFHDSDRANKYRANYYLRKLGINPAPPGRYPRRDAVKAFAYRATMALRSRVRRDRQTTPAGYGG